MVTWCMLQLMRGTVIPPTDGMVIMGRSPPSAFTQAL